MQKPRGKCKGRAVNAKATRQKCKGQHRQTHPFCFPERIVHDSNTRASGWGFVKWYKLSWHKAIITHLVYH